MRSLAAASGLTVCPVTPPPRAATAILAALAIFATVWVVVYPAFFPIRVILWSSASARRIFALLFRYVLAPRYYRSSHKFLLPAALTEHRVAKLKSTFMHQPRLAETNELAHQRSVGVEQRAFNPVAHG
jgi:hypothetical protein